MASDLDRLGARDWDHLRDAAAIIIGTQFGSTFMIQRKLRVGFSTAALLMECLEELGVIAPPHGDGRARNVLVTPARADAIADAITSAQQKITA